MHSSPKATITRISFRHHHSAATAIILSLTSLSLRARTASAFLPFTKHQNCCRPLLIAAASASSSVPFPTAEPKDKSMDYASLMTKTLEEHKLPLRNDKDLDALIESIGDRRFVLLGEASHGTHEFYTMRAHVTKRLIEEKGFDFVAVEGDWPGK